MTFPRPEAAYLLAIKQGTIPYPVVGEEIERLLEQVERAAAACNLPEAPPEGMADDFIAELYERVVKGGLA